MGLNRSKLKATELAFVDTNNIEYIVHDFERQGLVARTKDQLKSALSKLGSNNGTICIVDTIDIDEDLTIPENISLKFFNGGILKVLTQNISNENVGTGDGSTTEFSLAYPPVLENSETIYVDGTEQTRNTDYTINYETGVITFTSAPANGASITADYTRRFKLTINGGIDAGLFQIFSGDGVVTGNPKIEAAYPEWFGAKGDGVTDDTEAIQKAIDSLNKVYIQRNVLSNKLLINNDNCVFVLDVSATLKANNIEENSCILEVNSSNNKIVLHGTVDGSNLPIHLVIINGDNNYIEAEDLRNIVGTETSQEYLSGILVDGGDSNKIKIAKGYNLLQGSNPNSSCGRTVTVQGTATNTKIDYVYGENVNNVLVVGDTSSGTVVDNVAGKDVHDNVVYHLESDLNIGLIKYRSSNIGEEIVVTKGSLVCGKIIVESPFVRVLGLQNADKIYIGEIVVKADPGWDCGNIIGLRPNNSNTKKVVIGSVIGEFAGDNLMYFRNGTLDYLFLGIFNVIFYYKSSLYSQFVQLQNIRQLNFGDFKVSIVDYSNDVGNTTFYFNMNPELPSSITNIEFDILDINGNRLSTGAKVYCTGFKDNLDILSIKNARWFVPSWGFYIRENGYAPPNTINQVPVLGKWTSGLAFFYNSPSPGGNAGIICVRSGVAAPEWTASTSKDVGDKVVPTTDNGYYYECTVAGTTGSSEPTWPTNVGDTVTDGSVTWECKGTAALFKEFGQISS